MRFHTRYDGNILVNAMAVGLAETTKIFYAAASGVNMPIVYLGSKTGRDGIHGASMASAEFDDDCAEKRPTVQVGDPFAEKLLLEACLEIMEADCVIAIQDMGAAGLTCSAVEMGAKGDLGVDLDLDAVPTRETGMSAYEMMLSESQERMLMVLKPEKEKEAEAIFRKWGLDFAVVGYTTPSKRFVVKHGGDVMADLPIKELGDEAPVYDRPHVASPALPVIHARDVKSPLGISAALEKLIATPELCSKRWVWEQYDHVILGNTVQRPGGDAAVVRVQDGPKGLALTVDVTPRYCEADPFEGGKQAVAEAWRNITAVGGRPLAITDNLNFGNPERPEIMGQFVGCLKGISEACRALDFPVVSGNVSLYNETNGRGILPTPSIGGVGLLDDFTKSATLAFKSRGRGDPSGRRNPWLARAVRLSARHLRPRRGRAAAGRPCRRKAQRRRGARHDPRRHRDRGARCLRRRTSDRAGGDGDGQRHRRAAIGGAGGDRAACLLVRRRPGALHRDGAGGRGRAGAGEDERRRRALRADRHHRRRGYRALGRGAGLDCVAESRLRELVSGLYERRQLEPFRFWSGQNHGYIFCLKRFLHANGYPVRSKTLSSPVRAGLKTSRAWSG